MIGPASVEMSNEREIVPKRSQRFAARIARIAMNTKNAFSLVATIAANPSV